MYIYLYICICVCVCVCVYVYMMIYKQRWKPTLSPRRSASRSQQEEGSGGGGEAAQRCFDRGWDDAPAARSSIRQRHVVAGAGGSGSLQIAVCSFQSIAVRAFGCSPGYGGQTQTHQRQGSDCYRGCCFYQGCTIIGCYYRPCCYRGCCCVCV